MWEILQLSWSAPGLLSQGLSAGVWAVAPFCLVFVFVPEFLCLLEDGAKSPALETSGFFYS